ncbi:hypothetical protein JCM10207_008989 [Rhodosporidiobolus poonsookiae]
MTEHDEAPRSPHVTNKTVALLEKVHEPVPVVDEHLQKSLSALWGQPCFELVTLDPAASSTATGRRLGGVKTVPRARISLDHGPPRVVREDYKALWDGMQQRRMNLRIEGFAIWGQPGSGKSYALDIYTLVCIEQRIPVLRYEVGVDKGSLVIVVDGEPRLYSIPSRHFGSLDFKVDNYLLIDSSDLSNAISGKFCTSHHSFLPRTTMVLATSPHEPRYRAWAKHRSVLFATMALPSRGEVIAMSMLNDTASTEIGLSDANSAVSFHDIDFDIPSGFPEGGYADDVVEADMSDPLVELSTGYFIFAPLYQYHGNGPDARRIFRMHTVSPSLRKPALEDELLRYLPFSIFEMIRCWPGAATSLFNGAGKGHDMFYHTPLLEGSHAERWTNFVECKTIVPSTVLAERLFSAVAKMRARLQRQALDACMGTWVHDIFYRIYTALAIASEGSMTVQLVSKASPARPAQTITFSSGKRFPGWKPAAGDSAPAEQGVHPTLPLGSLDVAALIVGEDPSFSPPVPVDIALCTTTLSTSSLELSHLQVGTLRARLNERDGSRLPRGRRLFVFASTSEFEGRQLARRFMDKIDGFEVGFVTIYSAPVDYRKRN